MAEKLDPKQLVTCEEVAIFTMGEMADLVDLLERICLLPFHLPPPAAGPLDIAS